MNYCVILMKRELIIHTAKVVPSPRTTLLMIFRSVVLAATLTIHGATLDTEYVFGPLFPAEFKVKIPLAMAWKEPIAIGSSFKLAAVSFPRETEMMSTPSEMASSKAANTSESAHPNREQTLYTAILAEGTPPLAFPSAIP